MMIEDRNGGFVFHLYNFQLMTDFHTTALCSVYRMAERERREERAVWSYPGEGGIKNILGILF